MAASNLWKLAPAPSTPIEERCDCNVVAGVYLAHSLGANPLHCAACRGEVAPLRLEFTDDQVDQVADWNRLFGAIHALWLDSSGYEDWARRELCSAESEVNRRGLAVREAVAGPVPCAYLWFWSENDVGSGRPGRCPVCAGTVAALGNGYLECARCQVWV